MSWNYNIIPHAWEDQRKPLDDSYLTKISLGDDLNITHTVVTQGNHLT